MKVAVTDRGDLIVTVQVAPDNVSQPVQAVTSGPGSAVSVTTVPESKSAEQLAPQLIPSGDEVTVARLAAIPVFATVRV
jgi:hypothetical protein